MEARLRNLARDLGLPEGRVRRMIGVVVVGQMLDGLRAGLIKGAPNLELRLGTTRTRVSSDLDLVLRSDLTEFRAWLTLALRQGWAEFSGRLIDQVVEPAPRPAHMLMEGSLFLAEKDRMFAALFLHPS